MSESATPWTGGIDHGGSSSVGYFTWKKELHVNAYPHEPWCRFCGMGLDDQTSLKMMCQACRLAEGTDRLQSLMVAASTRMPSNPIIINTTA